MCKWGDTLDVPVTIPAALSHTGEARVETKPLDRCIAPLVVALNEHGIATVNSCCGHGRTSPEIALDDNASLVFAAGCWWWSVPGKAMHAADPARDFDRVLCALPVGITSSEWLLKILRKWKPIDTAFDATGRP